MFFQAFLLLQLLTGLFAQSTPQFSAPEFTVSLNESVDPPQSNFLELNCSQPNGTGIMYSIVTPSVPFSIANGSISADSVLDYEQTSNYTLNVTCFYLAQLPQAGSTTVQISLLPVNEFLPTFQNPPSPVVFVSETEPPGTVIVSTTVGVAAVTYSASDQDAGPDGNVFFTFNDPDPEVERYFAINKSTGDIMIIQSIDYDKNASISISIKITACDHDPPINLCPNKVITVFVTPENDNYPQFSNQSYRTNISEDTPGGAVVLTTVCTDADINVGQFSKITFLNISEAGITPLSDVLLAFALDSVTGSISVKNLDYESRQSYVFNLECRDTLGLTNTSTVFIAVNNVADEAPDFSQITQSRIINTSPPGTQVAAVQCVDGDTTINTVILYSIVDTSGQFSIGSDGRITVNSTLNEFVSYLKGYEVTVICREEVSPFLATSTTLSLEVIKEDTMPPSISSTSPINGGISVLENATIGNVIAGFTAADPDSPKVVFSLSGNTGNEFDIDSMTGVLTVGAALDRETISSYRLMVIATEVRALPGEPKSDSISVEITIVDVNDNSPSCGGTDFEANLEAGTYDSTTVFTFTCTDSDTGQNSALTYSLLSTAPSVSTQFSISGSTLQFGGNALASESFIVQAIVSDGGSPQMSTTLQVVVNITEPSGSTFPLFIVIIVIIIVIIVILVLLILCVVFAYVFWDHQHRRKDITVGDVITYGVAQENTISMSAVGFRNLDDAGEEGMAEEPTTITVRNQEDAGEIETPLTVNSEYWEFEDEIMKVELDGSHEIQPLETGEGSSEPPPGQHQGMRRFTSSQAPLLFANESAAAEYDELHDARAEVELTMTGL